MFRLAGRVVGVELQRDKEGKSRGFAVVVYDHPVEAVQVLFPLLIHLTPPPLLLLTISPPHSSFPLYLPLLQAISMLNNQQLFDRKLSVRFDKVEPDPPRR